MREKYSVREWQRRFQAGEFAAKDIHTQVGAGWFDWFCSDEALAGRLKQIGKVVMGVTDPFILDNYYVCFKNNCPLVGPLYDDVRFELLNDERDGKYFVVCKDSPHEEQKWVLYTERHGFDHPEYECGNLREMVKYVNKLGQELSQTVGESAETPKKAAPKRKKGAER